jgi:hypothetical protein
MTLSQLDARLRRLVALATGVRREQQGIDRGDRMLTPAEWQQYAEGLRTAAAALDSARVPLASALRRAQGEK